MDPLGDALLAVELLKHDPAGLGGIVLRGAGPARDAVVAALGPVRRLPVTIDDEALIGGRDLAATLAGQGGTVRPGLLARADGGLLLVAMAERMRDDLAARIATAMDTGEVAVERDGATARFPAQFGLVLLDDGRDDERVPDRLAERCAFRFDLGGVRPAAGAQISPRLRASAPPRETGSGFTGMRGGADHRPPEVPASEAMESLAGAAFALGIDSSRGPMMALRVARGLVQLDGRDGLSEDDVAMAARLVLAHRATRLPDAAPEETVEPPPPESSEPKPGDTLEDVVLAAVTAALPPDLLAAIAAGAGRRTSTGSGGGERRRSPMRGKPLGARAGLPRGGARLALIDTLRAAAPWQKLRGGEGRIAIRRDDLRIKRFETRADATTIFAVDASGSAAAARMGEAKGAVELLLAEAYVKRTEVALVAFRGNSAEVLLPPTRSLTRARRALADLPGGGGTPLAAGIDAAGAVAAAVRSRGRTPFVVLLSDGRGNVDGDRTIAAARGFAAGGTGAIFIDISTRPRTEGAEVAEAMRARYLPLPRADASGLAAAVRAAQ